MFVGLDIQVVVYCIHQQNRIHVFNSVSRLIIILFSFHSSMFENRHFISIEPNCSCVTYGSDSCSEDKLSTVCGEAHSCFFMSTLLLKVCGIYELNWFCFRFFFCCEITIRPISLGVFIQNSVSHQGYHSFSHALKGA